MRALSLGRARFCHEALVYDIMTTKNKQKLNTRLYLVYGQPRVNKRLPRGSAFKFE